MAYTRKPTKRRAVRRRKAPATRVTRRKTRKNPRYGTYRPVLKYTRKGWKRPAGAKLMRQGRYKKRPVRVNPRRRRRIVRRNPQFRLNQFLNQRFIMTTLTTGAGIGTGFLTIPAIKKMLPSDWTTGMGDKLLGLYNIGLGILIMAMMRRNRGAQTFGSLIAGVGAYDLLASNITQLGLPQVPRGGGMLADALPNTSEDVSASYAVARRPVSPVAQSEAALAANYALPVRAGYGTQDALPPHLAASYSDPGFMQSGFNGDSPFDDWQ